MFGSEVIGPVDPFFASFTLGGTQGGFILASLVFLPVSAMPDEQLLSWDWRIPFLVSALVMATGWWVRSSLGETPVFEQQTQRPGLPLVRLLQEHPRALALVVLSSLYAVISTIVSIYSLSYGVHSVGLPRPTLLWMLIVANAVGIVATPLCAALSDRVGRKPVFLLGAFGGAALIGRSSGRSARGTCRSSSPLGRCWSASSTAPPAGSGWRCCPSSSRPECGCPGWLWAPRSGSSSRASRRPSRPRWRGRSSPTGSPPRYSPAVPRSSLPSGPRPCGRRRRPRCTTSGRGEPVRAS